MKFLTKRKKLLPWASFIISLLSLFFAIKVYDSFHKREIQKRQIDIVLELIEDLQSERVLISWSTFNKNSRGFKALYSGNLVSIAQHLNQQKLGESGNKYVYLSEELVSSLQIEKYLINPLTPYTIVEQLKASFPNSATYSQLSDYHDDILILDIYNRFDFRDIKQYSQMKESTYYGTSFSEFKTFIKGIDRYRIATERWLYKQGIDEMNLHWLKQDYENHSNY